MNQENGRMFPQEERRRRREIQFWSKRRSKQREWRMELGRAVEEEAEGGVGVEWRALDWPLNGSVRARGGRRNPEKGTCTGAMCLQQVLTALQQAYLPACTGGEGSDLGGRAACGVLVNGRMWRTARHRPPPATKTHHLDVHCRE